MTMQIGILSDTHGLLRLEALEALQGSDHILHAGDVGNIEILEALRQIAPVTAIRGNIGTHGPCADLPATEAIELAGHLFYLVHSLHDLDINPRQAGVSCLVTGHSHKPLIAEQNGILYVNPGSAGPRRFGLPVTLAHLAITDCLSAELIPLL